MIKYLVVALLTLIHSAPLFSMAETPRKQERYDDLLQKGIAWTLKNDPELTVDAAEIFDTIIDEFRVHPQDVLPETIIDAWLYRAEIAIEGTQDEHYPQDFSLAKDLLKEAQAYIRVHADVPYDPEHLDLVRQKVLSELARRV